MVLASTSLSTVAIPVEAPTANHVSEKVAPPSYTTENVSIAHAEFTDESDVAISSISIPAAVIVAPSSVEGTSKVKSEITYKVRALHSTVTWNSLV